MFKNQITARGNTVPHNKAREACWQTMADLSISEKILYSGYKITMPNAELFAINPDREMMMISKCISNVPYVASDENLFLSVS